MQQHLEKIGVDMLFQTMVEDIIIEDGTAIGVETVKGDRFYADEIVSGIGREGADWFENVCRQHNIETSAGTVDIGVRVEFKNVKLPS